MKSRTLVLAGIFGAALAVQADFTSDFQEALQLYRKGETQEARRKFIEAAKIAGQEKAQCDSLHYAVLSAVKEKNYAEAEKIAADIPRDDYKKLSRMEILIAQGKGNELTAEFENEDLSKFPDFLAFDAYDCRGQAFFRVRKFDRAILDFQEAEKFIGSTLPGAALWNRLGAALNQAGQPDEALRYYRKTEALDKMQKYGIVRTAYCEAAGILADQKKFDEALKELEKIEPEQKGSYWYAYPLMVKGQIFARMEDREKAEAAYREAIEGAPETLKKSIERELGKLK